MGAKKRSRPSSAVKDTSKRQHFHNGSQIRKVQIIDKQQTKMTFLSKGTKAHNSKPLVKLFGRGGMAYGHGSILRTVRKDNELRCKLLNLGIRSRKGVEQALLELLYQFRNLKDWDAGGDDLFDVFRLIKGRVKWAASCSVDLIMQLFFALLRARLDCSQSLRTQNCCKVALRVDKIISYINGVDHLLSDYAIYQNLTLPIHNAIRKLPKKAKMPPSVIPGAAVPNAISCSSNKDPHNGSLAVLM
ncbi:hypothetical protein Daus18300_005263 [Diaporthe australafricana]|uniref:Uncharacterized protein n=1 Tax=Diaporthe australafricana TaxID=127596 RepID=A0ABR3X3J7_9PEZI